LEELSRNIDAPYSASARVHPRQERIEQRRGLGRCGSKLMGIRSHPRWRYPQK